MALYNLNEGAELLELSPESLENYAFNGRIPFARLHGVMVFREEELKKYREEHPRRNSGRPHYEKKGMTWEEKFESRHGKGSYERMVVDLAQRKFSKIAKEFGVGYEAVRLWYKEHYPEIGENSEEARFPA